MRSSSCTLGLEWRGAGYALNTSPTVFMEAEMTCVHCVPGSCPHLFINGEDKGPAEEMLFQVGVWISSVRNGTESAEHAIARLLSEPGRTYEIRYLP